MISERSFSVIKESGKVQPQYCHSDGGGISAIQFLNIGFEDVMNTLEESVFDLVC